MVVITRVRRAVLRGDVVYDDCKLSFTEASFRKKKGKRSECFLRVTMTPREYDNRITVYVNAFTSLAFSLLARTYLVGECPREVTRGMTT